MNEIDKQKSLRDWEAFAIRSQQGRKERQRIIARRDSNRVNTSTKGNHEISTKHHA